MSISYLTPPLAQPQLITDKMPPVPEGCRRVFLLWDGEEWQTTSRRYPLDTHFFDLPGFAPPPPKLEFPPLPPGQEYDNPEGFEPVKVKVKDWRPLTKYERSVRAHKERAHLIGSDGTDCGHITEYGANIRNFTIFVPRDTPFILPPAPKPPEFPPLPAGEHWNNPDNLTPEQVGEGFRLLTVNEVGRNRKMSNPRSKDIGCWVAGFWREQNWCGSNLDCTYRVSISTPIKTSAKTKKVPLGPGDFPPGAAVRQSINTHRWRMVMGVTETGVVLSGDLFLGFQDLMFNRWECQLLGATEWAPCYKEVET